MAIGERIRWFRKRHGLTQREVTIHLRGGNLLIAWKADNEPVFMTGSTTEVFRGKLRV